VSYLDYYAFDLADTRILCDLKEKTYGAHYAVGYKPEQGDFHIYYAA
jgi:hypothetical protein